MSSLGPATEMRAVPENEFFGRLRPSAERSGVTRLADITGLDRLGFPVWQAVRPAGRALSVHQGKGATALAARIGALCEAIESDCAEKVAPDGPTCSFRALDAWQRQTMLGDYCRSRNDRPDEEAAVSWCGATDLLSDRAHPLPYDFVSMDCTRAADERFDTTTTGLAVGTTEDEAIETGLSELLERDAVGEWLRADLVDRMATELDMTSVHFDWFGRWREELQLQGIRMKIFAFAAVEGMPVFRCFIAGGDAFGPGKRRFSGSAAHADPERALFKAFGEAVQSRLAAIAGTRDDILPSYYDRCFRSVWLGAPSLPPGFRRRSWTEVAPSPSGWKAIAGRLAERGFDRVAVKRLDGDLGIPVVKVFVPGLGSLARTRRPS